MTDISPAIGAASNFSKLTDRIREGSGLLWTSALTMTALAIVCVVLQQVDNRMVGDANTWHKPAKFFLSLAVQFATASWAVTLLPATERAGRLIRYSVVLMAASGWLEMAYIVFRASRAEASHFSYSTPAASIAYSLMGVGALVLTGTAFVIGWRLWKHRRDGLATEAAAVGLMLGAVLATLTAGYLSAQGGHSVGGTAGSGIGFFGWSTTGGDLRIAHFIGLHAMQVVPLAALSGRRGTVLAAAALIAAATLAVFLQAVSGMPLLRG